MPLNRYYGDLTREQFITARNKTLLNANNLIIESKLLFENGMIARAYFLASIACEEIGKYLLISSAAIDYVRGTLNWKNFWKRIRNHKAKNQTIELFENIFVSNDENFTNPELIKALINDMDELKMANLYSDMFQYDFYEPNEIADKSMTANLIALAENRLKFIEIFPISEKYLLTITKEQIEEADREMKQYIKNKYGHELNDYSKL
ncbi:MAG: AbiV family abortive infection protein [Oscillospiraceae bacterium]